MNLRNILPVATAAFLVAALPALACPDWSAAPNYGAVELSAGFTPDPHVVQITAGGSTHLGACGAELAGFVSVAPDFDLYWSGQSGRLTIAAESSADTVILVSDPNGNWLFNDDHNGLNPAVVIQNPAEGLYDIWVGTWGSDTAPARLIITELNH